MALDFKKEIDHTRILVIIIPSIQYTKVIVDIAKQLSDNYDKTCYVSLNRPHEALINSLIKNKVDTKKFTFVDAISHVTQTKVETQADCIFVSSPRSLTELTLAIKKASMKKPVALLFDSLSTLLIYHKGPDVTQFIHAMINKIRMGDMVAVFTVLKGDVNTGIIKDISMFVDKVIEL